MVDRDDTRWERWGAIGGFLFVIGMLLLFFVAGEAPGEPPPAPPPPYYRDKKARGTGRLSAIATVAGAGSIVLLLGAAGVFIASALSALDPGNTNFEFDLSTHEMVVGAGFGLFLYHMVLAGALVAATSVLSIRTGVFPAWFGWIGIVLAVALLIPVVSFFALLVYWAWVVVIAIFLLTGRGIRAAPRMMPPA